MSNIDPDIRQNYKDLHESTGESYESIARRVGAHGDAQLASWLRSQAKGEDEKPEEESRSEPPQGRLPAKQETAAAEAEAKAAAEAEAAKEAEAKAAAAKTREAAARK